jgi:hypothetical protein
MNVPAIDIPGDIPGDISGDISERDSTALSLEAVELELALQLSDATQFDRVLADARATLLFAVHGADVADAPSVSAVVVGEGDNRQFLIVTRPPDGNVCVEDARTSRNPLARLAPSFAAVMERWAG